MKRGLTLGFVLGVLLPGLCLAQKQTVTGREPPSRERAIAKVISELTVVRDGTPARLAVDFEDEAYLAVTATDRRGEDITLEFEPNETSRVLRPLLPADTEPELFGRDLFSVSDLFVYQAAKVAGTPIPSEELLPFDATVTEQPHDDLSVFVVDHELVLIGLWLDGKRIGTYYAVNMDVEADDVEIEPTRDDPSGEPGEAKLRADDRARRAVCQKLGEWCVSDRYDMPTVIACLVWLVYCNSV